MSEVVKVKRFLRSPTQKVVFLQMNFKIYISINKTDALHIQYKHLSEIHLSIRVSFTFISYNKIFVYLTLTAIFNVIFINKIPLFSAFYLHGSYAGRVSTA